MFLAMHDPSWGLSGDLVAEVCLFNGMRAVCGFAVVAGAGSEGAVLCPFMFFSTGGAVMIGCGRSRLGRGLC